MPEHNKNKCAKMRINERISIDGFQVGLLKHETILDLKALNTKVFCSKHIHLP